MKSALALVIGLDDYEHLIKLDNAVNDAKVIGDALENLGFTVKRGLDISIEEIDDLIEEFCKELSNHEVGLFYFAGHGFQNDGKNLLAGKETNDFKFSSAERSSILLKDLIGKMDKSGVPAKVIILDACRKPIIDKVRGGFGNDFAPVFAPKGTLIAFSTSPGEGAKDGTGLNSHYTLAFLKHLKQENIEIELFFKRIRATVSAATQGAQTSWEHTSLIGPLILNSGQLRHSKNLPYHDRVIADHKFKATNSGSEIDRLLVDLGGDFYKQNNAIDSIQNISLEAWSDDQLFLLGRGLINCVENNSFSALEIFKDLRTWLVDHGKERANHILNGLLYEIYFNGQGLFRKGSLKKASFKEVLDLQSDQRFAQSFTMISEQLTPFRGRLLYIPGLNTFNLPIDLTIERQKEGSDYIKVAAVNIHGRNITTTAFEGDCPTKFVSKDGLMQILSKELFVPINKITLNPSLPDEVRISIPFSDYTLRCTIDLFDEDQKLQPFFFRIN